MKNTVIVLFLLLGIIVQAQENEISEINNATNLESKVNLQSEGVVVFGKKPITEILATSCGTFTKIINAEDSYPFKVYALHSENENWNTQNDVYNSIRAKVPGVRISSTYLNETPTITTRGCDDTVVIVDGVRFDVDILKTLNPADIESIAVSNSVAATNYFLNNRN